MSVENEMIECPISPSTNKLLQAYLAVSNESSESILEEIGHTIEEALKKHLLKRMLESVRDNHGDVLLEFAKENYGDVIASEYVDQAPAYDPLKIATLSSDYDETWVDHKPAKSSGITDADIDNDMIVDDPNTEAAADAMSVEINSTEDMAKMLLANDNITAKEIPAAPMAINPLEQRRRKVLKTKATVSMGVGPASGIDGGVTV